MGRRPPHVKPPAHLSKNVPVPEPEPAKAPGEQRDPLDLSTTRYGDWTLKGIAIDF